MPLVENHPAETRKKLTRRALRQQQRQRLGRRQQHIRQPTLLPRPHRRARVARARLNRHRQPQLVNRQPQRRLNVARHRPQWRHIQEPQPLNRPRPLSLRLIHHPRQWTKIRRVRLTRTRRHLNQPRLTRKIRPPRLTLKRERTKPPPPHPTLKARQRLHRPPPFAAASLHHRCMTTPSRNDYTVAA